MVEVVKPENNKNLQNELDFFDQRLENSLRNLGLNPVDLKN